MTKFKFKSEKIHYYNTKNEKKLLYLLIKIKNMIINKYPFSALLFFLAIFSNSCNSSNTEENKVISKNGKIAEDFEDCKLSEEYKNRTIDSFVKWIKFKLNKTKQTGGKWSRKYKQSINCKRPKGFSQKQYCKYTRKKR